MRRNTLFALGAIVVVAAATLLFFNLSDSRAIQPDSPTNPPAANPTPEAQAVRVVEVREGRLETVRNVSGTLEAATDAQVSSEGGGRVTGVLKREGDRVAEGETVVVLDDTALRQQLQGARLGLQNAQIQLEAARRQTPEGVAQAQLALESAQSALQSAEQVYQANQRLFELQGVSQAELNGSRNAVDQARTALRTAQDGLARAQRSNQEGVAQLRVQVEQARNQIAQIERQIAQTRVKAPFAGTVVEQKAEVGVTLAPGSPVFRLVDTGSLRVRFSVPASDSARLPVGAQIAVVAGGQRFQAKVSRSAGSPVQNRLVPLQARFLNRQETGGLAVGAVVSVSYNLRLARGTLVPSGAIQTEEGASFVLVAKDGQARRVRVQILGESGGRVAVSGLKAGSPLIFPLPSGLQTGSPVRVLGGN